MKKLLVLLTVVLLLAGCHKKTDAQRFAEEFGVSEENSVSYLKKDDIIYQLTHGTHVVLFTTPGSIESKYELGPLIKAVNSHSGIILYYFDIEKIPDDLKKQINELFVPFNVELSDMTAVFVKKSDISAVVLRKAIYSSIADYQQLVDEIADETPPGCHDC